jgi:hypothetical protein
MPGKTDFCVKSLTKIACGKGKPTFVPGAVNGGKEPFSPDLTVGILGVI